MNAQRLIFHRTGPPADVLELENFTPPDPQTGEVLIALDAAPINPADLNTIEGTYGVKLALPATPGIEGCGTIIAGNAAGFTHGDRVMFLRRGATWTTHTIAKTTDVFRLPPGIDPLQAAMLKVNPATAWCLLHEFTDLAPGETIVQNLGNSAVARCVIQLAKRLGIRTISFVRNPAQIAKLKSLGGDDVLTDDDAGLAIAKEILGGANAALAFNAVGGDSALRLMKLLRAGASHVTYGAMGRKPITLPNGLLIFQNIHVRGLWVTRWLEKTPPERVTEVYQNLAASITAGELAQPIDTTFSLAEFPAALARLKAEARTGKVLFQM